MYFERPFPHEKSDPRRVGFEIGQRIIALYLCELLLKYTLDKSDISYKNVHNLHYLYSKFPQDEKKVAKERYREILQNRWKWTWSFARTLESHLRYLGKNPVRDVRYFWKSNYSSRPLLLSAGNLHTLVYALFIVLHDYPYTPSIIEKRFETEFVNPEKSLIAKKRNRGTGRENSGRWMVTGWEFTGWKVFWTITMPIPRMKRETGERSGSWWGGRLSDCICSSCF